MPLRAADDQRKLQDSLLSRARTPTGFGQYLSSVRIQGLRGIQDLTVEFNYPVTALVGLNGSAKSTVLACVACAYNRGEGARSPFFSVFFPPTRWDKLSGIVITYRCYRDQRDVSYTFTKKSIRWRGYDRRPVRPVVYLPLSRLVPKTELRVFATLYQAIRSETTLREIEIEAEAVHHASRILDIPYDRLAEGQVLSSNKRSHSLTVAGRGTVSYSELHMGAGEAAVIDLVRTVLKTPIDSLVVIEEIENALHPSAQERLVHFLEQQASTRGIQTVVTTHSGYVLEALPAQARWLLLRPPNGPVEALPEVSTAQALSRLTDTPQVEFSCYVEDDLSAEWLKEILNKHASGFIDRLSIRASGGRDGIPAQVAVHRKILHHQKCIPVYDGDCETKSEPARDDPVFRLPGGQPPERVLFGGDVDWLAQRLALRLCRDPGRVKQAVQKVRRLYRDHHDWIHALAKSIQDSVNVVQNAVVLAWLAADNIEAKALADGIVTWFTE